MNLLYTSSNIDIYHDEPNGWLYADWKGYQTERYVHMGCDCMLNWLVTCQLSKVLNDNSNVVGIWNDASEWVAKDWFPRMRSAGLKHFAWVYSPARLSQISTDETLEHAEPGTAHLFHSLADAQRWLAAQAD